MEKDMLSIINNHLDNCINDFAKTIEYGYGWILKEDILRQFTLNYEEFASPLFDKVTLENIISNKLANKVLVKTEKEAFEEGLLDL